jgi:hypothetical protein
MTQTSIDVDQVVREVLARLGLAPARTPRTACQPVSRETRVGNSPLSSGAGDEDGPPAGATRIEGQLTVSQRVVSLAGLDGRLDGVRQLVVPPRAIVTPSVRDELRRRQIALVFGPPAAAAESEEGRLVLMAAGPFDPAALAAALAAEGLMVDAHRSSCVIAATDRLASRLAEEKTVGLLATDNIVAGLCLANRLPGVRAVLGTSAGTIAAEASSVGANLLVASPAVLSPVQLKQVAVEFCRHASHECPEVFRKRLS